jgi:hypothetical protein
MKWDVFSGRRRERPAREKDEIDNLIHTIEKFAPREYREERDTYYYNYRVMGMYRKPLVHLLETISWKGLKGGRAPFSPDLFLRLKDFYDPKDRLSTTDAAGDVGLMRKFSALLLYFYGKKDFQKSEIKDWLDGM